MSYWLFKLTLTLIIVPILFRITFSTIKLTSTLTQDTFYRCRLFINPFDHIKYSQVHIFCFIRNTYSTERIVYNITAPITPIHTNVSSNTSVGPSPRTRISLFLLSACTDKLLSTQKRTTFYHTHHLVTKTVSRDQIQYHNHYTHICQDQHSLLTSQLQSNNHLV